MNKNGKDAKSASMRNIVRRMVAVGATAALGAAGLVACTPSSDSNGASGDLQQVTFALPNERSIQYYAHYIAEEMGYFEEEGLDVTFQVVDGSSSVVQQVAAGNAEIGMTAGSAFLQGAARDLPLRWVYTWWYENTYDLAVPTESGITSIEELGDGSAIGVSSMSGGEVPEIRGIMSGDLGFVEEEDYTILPVGDGGALTYQALESGEVQAYSSSVFDVSAVSQAGLELTTLFEGDYLYLPSLGHIATQDYIDNDSDVLVKFNRAVLKGFEFAKTNPDAGKAITKIHGPELFEDPTVGDAYWDTTWKATQAPDTIESLGQAYMPGWETYLRLVKSGTEEEGAIAEGSVDLSVVMVNDLLPESNEFDREAVQKQATEYEVE